VKGPQGGGHEEVAQEQVDPKDVAQEQVGPKEVAQEQVDPKVVAQDLEEGLHHPQ
jgi:hypothetical protein